MNRVWLVVLVLTIAVLVAGCDHDDATATPNHAEQNQTVQAQPDIDPFPVRFSCTDATGDIAFLRGVAPVVEGLAAALAGVPDNAAQCGTDPDRDVFSDSEAIACTPDLSICESLVGGETFRACYPEQTAALLEISSARFASAFDEYQDLVLCDPPLADKQSSGTSSETATQPASTTTPTAVEPTTAPSLPTPAPTPLPDNAITSELVPNGFGLPGNGGALTLVFEEEPGSCLYQIVAGVAYDPDAIAYSYTQTYQGLTETLAFTATGDVLSQNRTEARPRRHLGTVWPTNENGRDYIGFAAFGDSAFSSRTGINGNADACGQRAGQAITRDGITITNPTVWYPLNASEPTPISAGEPTTQTQALDLLAWAEEFWANPPVDVSFLTLTNGDEKLFTYLQGPIVNGQRIEIARAHFNNDTISQIGIVDADHDPSEFCIGGCGFPSPILFMLDIINIDQATLDYGIVQGAIGETVINYDPYTGPDCQGCRPATTDDLTRFWDFVDLTIAQN